VLQSLQVASVERLIHAENAKSAARGRIIHLLCFWFNLRTLSEKRRILTEQIVKKAKGSEEGRERRIAVRTFSNVKSSRDKQGFTLHKEKHHVRVTTSRP
jgi:hypothetical protein